MDAHTFERLRSLFEQACDLAAAEQDEVVARATAEDAELGARLAGLLHAHRAHAGNTNAQQQKVVDVVDDLFGATIPNTGILIGPYALREEIGRGGMGVVFRAERVDGRVNQEVAVKILNRALLGERAMQRFRLERDIVAGFEHPYIARLFSVEETSDGSPCMIMERVDGVPITEYVTRSRLPLRARLDLFLKVCEAVQHAHSRLILHRDLKPSNILVTNDGTPKLIDFGVAKSISMSELEPSTRTHERFFSPSNAAPEQVLGGAMGVACDVYQLGTVLYELLCGAPVFDLSKLTASEVERHILHHVPLPPSERLAQTKPSGDSEMASRDLRALAREIRGDLDSVVLHALRKRASERYATVEQLADDVRNVIARRPIGARRDHRLYRMRKFLRRNALAVSMSLIVGVALSAFLVALLLQTQRLQQERDTARLERDRADKTSEFMVDVLASGDPEQSLSRDMPISVVIDRARQRLQTGLGSDLSLKIRMLGVLALVYYNVGDTEEALKLIEQGKQMAENAAQLEPRSLIEFEVNSALIMHETDRLEKSEAAARRALSLHGRLGDPAGKQLPARLALLHSTLPRMERGAWRQAYLDLLHDMEADSQIDPAVLAHVRAVVGHNLNFCKDFANAERVIRQSLEYAEAHFPASHVDVILGRTALATLLDLTDRSQEALDVLEPLLNAQSSMYGANAPNLLEMQLRIVRVQIRAGKIEEARDRIKAVRETVRNFPDASVDIRKRLAVAETELLLADGRLDDAERGYVEIVAETRRLGYMADALVLSHWLGAVQMRLGKFSEAERSFASSLEGAKWDWPAQGEWALAHAEVLHCLGRNTESGDRLASAQSLIAQYPDVLGKFAPRAQALSKALATSNSTHEATLTVCAHPTEQEGLLGHAPEYSLPHEENLDVP
jgi:serine/threonine-protein kinase